MKRSRTSRLGYTVMEVMMSLGILALGAGGVVALQRTTLLANTNARNLATANAIAQAWVERLRFDALQWNSTTDLTNDTIWLKTALSNPTWATPPPGLTVASPDADIMGANNNPTDPPPLAASAFCTQLRLTKFATAAMPNFDKIIRVEVRVLWSHGGYPIVCDAAFNPTDVAVRNLYGAVYVTSAVQQNTPP